MSKEWDQRRGAKSDSRVANRYVKGVQGGGGCLMALVMLPFTALLALLKRK